MTVAVRRISNGVAQPGQLSEKRPVAGYLRSATELEGDALRKQLEAIVRYAREHDMQLLRIYCDECSSGLRIDGRTGLQQMFRDIESGDGDFDALLLLDPSRWGRFHVPDHSACLEYACGTTGIEVHYCAEGSSDDETPISTIVKSIKRVMAREYARELTTPRQRRAVLERRIAADGDGNTANSSAEQDGVSDDAAGAGPARPPSE